jgi:hypothetical protein
MWSAKIWLDPVRYEGSYGFSAVELRRIERLVEEQAESLLKAWHEYFGDGPKASPGSQR